MAGRKKKTEGQEKKEAEIRIEEYIRTADIPADEGHIYSGETLGMEARAGGWMKAAGQIEDTYSLADLQKKRYEKLIPFLIRYFKRKSRRQGENPLEKLTEEELRMLFEEIRRGRITSRQVSDSPSEVWMTALAGQLQAEFQRNGLREEFRTDEYVRRLLLEFDEEFCRDAVLPGLALGSQERKKLEREVLLPALGELLGDFRKVPAYKYVIHYLMDQYQIAFRSEREANRERFLRAVGEERISLEHTAGAFEENWMRELTIRMRKQLTENGMDEKDCDDAFIRRLLLEPQESDAAFLVAPDSETRRAEEKELGRILRLPGAQRAQELIRYLLEYSFEPEEEPDDGVELLFAEIENGTIRADAKKAGKSRADKYLDYLIERVMRTFQENGLPKEYCEAAYIRRMLLDFTETDLLEVLAPAFSMSEKDLTGFLNRAFGRASLNLYQPEEFLLLLALTYRDGGRTVYQTYRELKNYYKEKKELLTRKEAAADEAVKKAGRKKEAADEAAAEAPALDTQYIRRHGKEWLPAPESRLLFDGDTCTDATVKPELAALLDWHMRLSGGGKRTSEKLFRDLLAEVMGLYTNEICREGAVLQEKKEKAGKAYFYTVGGGMLQLWYRPEKEIRLAKGTVFYGLKDPEQEDKMANRTRFLLMEDTVLEPRGMMTVSVRVRTISGNGGKALIKNGTAFAFEQVPGWSEAENQELSERIGRVNAEKGVRSSAGTEKDNGILTVECKAGAFIPAGSRFVFEEDGEICCRVETVEDTGAWIEYSVRARAVTEKPAEEKKNLTLKKGTILQPADDIPGLRMAVTEGSVKRYRSKEETMLRLMCEPGVTVPAHTMLVCEEGEKQYCFETLEPYESVLTLMKEVPVESADLEELYGSGIPYSEIAQKTLAETRTVCCMETPVDGIEQIFNINPFKFGDSSEGKGQERTIRICGCRQERVREPVEQTPGYLSSRDGASGWRLESYVRGVRYSKDGNLNVRYDIASDGDITYRGPAGERQRAEGRLKVKFSTHGAFLRTGTVFVHQDEESGEEYRYRTLEHFVNMQLSEFMRYFFGTDEKPEEEDGTSDESYREDMEERVESGTDAHYKWFEDGRIEYGESKKFGSLGDQKKRACLMTLLFLRFVKKYQEDFDKDRLEDTSAAAKRNSFISQVDEALGSCGLPAFYLGNPYDRLLVYLMIAAQPADVMRGIWADMKRKNGAKGQKKGKKL